MKNLIRILFIALFFSLNILSCGEKEIQPKRPEMELDTIIDDPVDEIVSDTIDTDSGDNDDSDIPCGLHNGKQLYKGPKGGCYYINSNGNKTYVDRSECDC